VILFAFLCCTNVKFSFSVLITLTVLSLVNLFAINSWFRSLVGRQNSIRPVKN